jgi:hypothetical protein
MSPRRVLRLDEMPGTRPAVRWRGGVIAMRRIGVIVALGALLSMLGGVVTAAPALAGGRGDGWVFQDFFPGFSSDNCGFHVQATQDVDKVFTKTLKTADGSTIMLTTGAAKITFTNTTNGKSITEVTSGPAKATINPDGSSTFRATGHQPMDLSLADQQRFGLPGIFVSVGPLTGAADANFNLTSLNVQGHILVNICAALS